jgi:hypothetical protein
MATLVIEVETSRKFDEDFEEAINRLLQEQPDFQMSVNSIRKK